LEKRAEWEGGGSGVMALKLKNLPYFLAAGWGGACTRNYKTNFT
jgi:hypothetical protein